MSIYESLRTGINDFGYGDRFKGYARMPVLNADQPAQIVGLTSPDKRPSVETLNLAPPFERFFIECALPEKLRFKSTTVNTNKVLRQAARIGMAQEGAVLHDETLAIGMDIVAGECNALPFDKIGDNEAIFLQAKWFLDCKSYYMSGSDPTEADPLCMSNFHVRIALGADGFPLPLPHVTPEMLDNSFRDSALALWVGQDGTPYSIFSMHAAGESKEWKDGVGLDSRGLLYKQTVEQFNYYLPLLYAINSLHNKRTVVQTVQHSRQVRRTAQRNGQQPPDQRTIVIRDFVTIMQGARKAQSEGNEYPLGDVIGHYRNYGVNGRTGLLFGKYRGTFFVPSFVRGNPDKGATDHDYVLKAGMAA